MAADAPSEMAVDTLLIAVSDTVTQLKEEPQATTVFLFFYEPCGRWMAMSILSAFLILTRKHGLPSKCLHTVMLVRG